MRKILNKNIIVLLRIMNIIKYENEYATKRKTVTPNL